MDAQRSPRTPWIIVTAVIIAAVLLGLALIVGNAVLLWVAIAVLVLVAVAAAVLPGRAGRRPISFTEEFPKNTIGPRATTDGYSTPPINSRRHPDPAPKAGALREVTAIDSPEPPDDERVFPQYVNLAPQDRLRRDHGRTYIEKRRDVTVEDDDQEP